MMSSLVERLDAAVSRWCLARSHNIRDLRRHARWRVPGPVFHYVDGAADDEVTLERNQRDFGRYELLPRYLVDVHEVDTSTRVMGAPVEFPVVLAPTGMSRMIHSDGELAVAAAAAKAGTIYSLSTVSSRSIEEVAAVCAGPKWFQIYVLRDRDLIREFLDRCRAANYHGLCLTIDVPVSGNRERDLYTGMMIPPKLTLSSYLSFLAHPLWSIKYAMSEPFQLANVAHKAPPGQRDAVALSQYIAEQFDPTVTWDDAAWMIGEWGGPFAIKGIGCVDDALRAKRIGASALIVSNHGGRQLDGAASAIGLLAEIKAAVGDDMEVILDGGVRRGTDVIKALALGASACMVGRPYLFGLGAGGEAGVSRALALLRAEIQRDMALLGCARVDQIGPQHVREYAGS